MNNQDTRYFSKVETDWENQQMSESKKRTSKEKSYLVKSLIQTKNCFEAERWLEAQE